METVRMKALKPMRLNTRRMAAGAEFEVSARKGRVLRAIGKAEYFISEAVAPSPEPLKLSLVEEYRQVTGSAPDGRWREKRIRDEIKAARAKPALPPLPLPPVPVTEGSDDA